MALFNENGDELTPEEIQELLAQNGNSQKNEPGWRKALLEDAERGREAVAAKAEADARALAAERKLALINAGVKLDTPLGKYFAETYNGDISEEAIKNAAGVIGLIPIAQAPVVQEELAALERIANASTSVSAPSTTLSEVDQIEAFVGTKEEFDAFVAKLGSEVQRGNMGAKWDSNPQKPIVTPK